ncbi:MAG: transporter substrate-binding domain-containing protein [Desulfurivibrionaceae bacterium]|nr:transporter substrate-binding domain-containing protein [Desulfurivibrionaceae bacterium]
MNHNIFSGIILIVSIFFAIGTPYAEVQVQDDSPQKRHIRVGVFDNYPIVYESEGLITGFHLELLKEVAKQEGWILDYIFAGSPKNVLQGLESGNLDIGMGLAPTPARERFLEFTNEKNGVLQGRIVVKSEAENIDSIRALIGKNLAVVNRDVVGENGIEIFEKFGIETNFKLVSSNDELVRALMTNAVDAGIFNSLQSEKYAKQYDLHPTSILFDPIDVHYAVPKGRNRYIVEALDRHLHKWKSTNGSIYYEMKNMFLTTPATDMPKYTNRELLIALSVCLLFILLGIMLGNFMATEMTAEHGNISRVHIKQIFQFILAMSVSFWVLDSFIEWFLFNEEQRLSLLELLITRVPLENLYIRAMFFLVCCFCGLFLARYISKYEKLLNVVLASVNRFKQLTDNARDMIFRMTLPNGEYEFVSKASSAIFGYSPEEFYQTPLLVEKLTHPDWKNYFHDQWENLLTGAIPPYFEYQIINKTGEVRWVNQRNTLYFDESGKPSAVEGIVTDVTEQKKVGAEKTNMPPVN